MTGHHQIQAPDFGDGREVGIVDRQDFRRVRRHAFERFIPIRRAIVIIIETDQHRRTGDRSERQILVGQDFHTVGFYPPTDVHAADAVIPVTQHGVNAERRRQIPERGHFLESGRRGGDVSQYQHDVRTLGVDPGDDLLQPIGVAITAEMRIRNGGNLHLPFAAADAHRIFADGQESRLDEAAVKDYEPKGRGRYGRQREPIWPAINPFPPPQPGGQHGQAEHQEGDDGVEEEDGEHWFWGTSRVTRDT